MRRAPNVLKLSPKFLPSSAAAPAKRMRARLDSVGQLVTAEEKCERRGYTLEEIFLSASRRTAIVRVRHEIWHGMRSAGLTFWAIADCFGVDHSTVMCGVRNHGVRIENIRG